MINLDYSEELKVALSLAGKVSKLLLKNRNTKAIKEGLELKAEIDKKANKLIEGIIKRKFPEDSILSEEDIRTDLNSRIWIIDPLDGTTNYLNALPFYSSLIALWDDGELVLGVCALPSVNEMIWAVKGRGAHIGNRKLRVNNTIPINKAVVALEQGYNQEKTKKMLKIYQRLKACAGTASMFFANGYTLSLIAKGQLPGYINLSSKIWESAGLLIIKEAGGKITDLKGQGLKLKFNDTSGFEFVVSSRRIHNDLLNLINS